MLRLLLAGLGVVTVAVVAIVIAAGGDEVGEVQVVVPQATNVIAGQEIRIAGRAVGKVTETEPARGGRAARLTLALDEEAWPLRSADTLELRWGGTISYANRYLSIHRGPATAPPVPDGGALRAAQIQVAPEFDDVLSIFTRPVRRDVKSFLGRGGAALAPASGDLRRAIHRGAPALEQASDVLRQLSADGDALATLVGSTSRVVRATRAARPGIGSLDRGRRHHGRRARAAQ